MCRQQESNQPDSHSLQDEGNSLSEPANDSHKPSHKSQITQRFLDNLHTQLIKGNVSSSPDAQRELRITLLNELGIRLSIWRIQHNYSRQALAIQLQTETDLLLSLEHEIAQPEDVTETFLRSLRACMRTPALEQEIIALINLYLNN